MTLLWGEDPAHTTTTRDNPPYPDARHDIAPVQWQRLAARYGPLPTPPPRAGERGWDWESSAPDERWRVVLVWCGALAITVGVWLLVGYAFVRAMDGVRWP